mmetsp:Transcript_9773/g.17610  ORF Transcript_9773/g.17610 Transcript_9773/m.17610 type:complete len:337 (+) Transcript_9773:242-1252(+)
MIGVMSGFSSSSCGRRNRHLKVETEVCVPLRGSDLISPNTLIDRIDVLVPNVKEEEEIQWDFEENELIAFGEEYFGEGLELVDDGLYQDSDQEKDPIDTIDDDQKLTSTENSVAELKYNSKLFRESGKRMISEGHELSTVVEQPVMKRQITPIEIDRVFSVEACKLERQVSNLDNRSLIEGLAFDVSFLGIQSREPSQSGDFSDSMHSMQSLDEMGLLDDVSTEDAAFNRQRRAKVRSLQRKKSESISRFWSQHSSELNSKKELTSTEREKEKEKELFRLRRNREAAMRSRFEKKQRMQNLEEQNKELEDKVRELGLENQKLKNELEALVQSKRNV